MSEQMRKVGVVVLVIVSVLCAIGFACMVGTIMHGGSQAIVAGPDKAVMPSASGWIVTVLLGLGTLLGGRWAGWLATAAKVVPVISQVAGLTRIQPDSPNEQVIPPAPPSPPNSHEALLSALLTTLEIDAGRSVKSSGSHSLGGGTITWSVEFIPATEGGT